MNPRRRGRSGLPSSRGSGSTASSPLNIPTLNESRVEPFGVYVHIPFCAKRCDYCAFATWTDRIHLVDEYVRACITDLDRAIAGGLAPATSVFFGGGTPSLLPADSLIAILDRIPRTTDAEVTIECNPDTVSRELVARYRR